MGAALNKDVAPVAGGVVGWGGGDPAAALNNEVREPPPVAVGAAAVAGVAGAAGAGAAVEPAASAAKRDVLVAAVGAVEVEVEAIETAEKETAEAVVVDGEAVRGGGEPVGGADANREVTAGLEAAEEGACDLMVWRRAGGRGEDRICGTHSHSPTG